MSRKMNMKVIFDNTQVLIPVTYKLKMLLRCAIEATLAYEHYNNDVQVSVTLTDDAGIHEVNLEMRDIDRPTDVLSFPMFDLVPGEHPDEMDADPATGLIPLGDMCLSLERATAQAKEFGHSVKREVGYLTIHSMLHLLGYDHLDEGPMKAQMRAREEAIAATIPGMSRN